MSRQLRLAAALSAATAALLALGLPLSILLLLDPASSAACGGTPAGPGPGSVPGVPQQFLGIYESAAQQYGLGNDGWAYLAALNYAESSFGADNGPGTGVLSGSNFAGAAGPMQIGVGGAATDNWDTVKALIPPNLPGGAQPPNVYNETDAVYAAAALLHSIGAPGDWAAALRHWNNDPAEWAQVNQLVARYTSTAQGTQGTQGSPSPVGAGQGSAAGYVSGLAGVKVGFAVVAAGGQVLAQENATMQVPGASITKAMLLVAYLHQLAGAPLGPVASAHLQAMIEQSSNPDGSWVYAHLGAHAVQHVAAAAGMTRFRLDVSDPSYTLGQSLVTALDQARLFAKIDQLLPARYRQYGIGLLQSISAGDRWGILNAGVGVGASKAGWKPEPGAGWVVNQAGQVQVQGQSAGLAVVSEGSASLTAGERIMQTVAGDLLANAQASAGSGSQCAALSGPTVPGAVAKIDPQTGLAAIPQGAPVQVQQMIAAGNKIISQAYSWGGGHCAQASAGPSGLAACPGSRENGAAGYDCSGAVEDLLYNGGGVIREIAAGFPASGDLESRGVHGRGAWITVYASAPHTFIEVAGIVMDTSHYAPVQPASPPTGPRWQPASMIPAQLNDGNAWSLVHPQGF